MSEKRKIKRYKKINNKVFVASNLLCIAGMTSLMAVGSLGFVKNIKRTNDVFEKISMDSSFSGYRESEIQLRLKKIEENIHNINVVFNNYVQGNITESQFNTISSKFYGEIDQIKSDIEKIQSGEYLLDNLQNNETIKNMHVELEECQRFQNNSMRKYYSGLALGGALVIADTVYLRNKAKMDKATDEEDETLENEFGL